MAGTAQLLSEARAAYAQRDWVAAREAFRAAREIEPLHADDLYALASAAWWLGDLDAALPAMQEAFRLHVADDRPADAALVALDLGYTLLIRGEEAQGTGWISRAMHLLEAEPEGPVHAYLVYLEFEESFEAGDLDGAMDAARRVHDAGRRHGDDTLVALGVLGRGRVLVRQGDVARGMALLDEAMVAAISDDLDPGWAGNIYCHLMVVCDEIADLRRAGEWTRATERWCQGMPGAGPFLGICRVHRAQILSVTGDWKQAEREVVQVADELAHFDVAIVAEAHYQLGELRRQRGDLAGAERAYRDGHRLGRDPQPGLALVRMSTGRIGSASEAIGSALTAATDPTARARLLPAAVEIAVAAGDAAAAQAHAREMAEIAAAFDTSGFHARAHHTAAVAQLAAEGAEAALTALKRAARAWQQLGARYEAARVRLLLSGAYDAVGDRESAQLEREAAEEELTRLGAARPSLPHLAPARNRDGLTDREVEVLSLVATGKTNLEIAAELVLSVRTVERHLSTVYDKLGVHGRSARAAAVSYALRERLLHTP